jgi:monofunctional biosynthetic peptidoglycan transglycosylase
LKVALAVGGLFGVAIGAFGPLVRYEANRVAARYGGEISVERVTPTWRGVALKDVDIALQEVPSAKIHLDEIEIGLGFSGRTVALRGGKVVAVGSREALIQQVEAWRARQVTPSTGEAEPRERSEAGGRGSIEVDGIDIDWRNASDSPTEAVLAKNVRFARVEGGGLTIAADDATLSLGRGNVSVRAGSLTLSRSGERGYRIRALSAADVNAEITVPALEEKAAPANQTAPPTAKPGRPSLEKEVPADEQDPEGGDGHLLPRVQGQALQRRLSAAARAVDSMIEPGAKIALAHVNARVRHGDEVLHLGPGELSVRGDPEKMIVELSPGAEAVRDKSPGETQQALTFRLSVPTSARADAGGEIEADVRGGPIWLSTLGVRDGDFGIFDVGATSLVTRSHLVLSADGAELTIDGDGSIKNLSIRSDALSEDPVAGLDLAWRAKAKVALDGSRLRVDEGEVDLGAIQLIARGQYERVGGAHRVRAEFDVPLASCQSMLDSVPKGLAPKLSGMRMAGSFALRGTARFDTARLDQDFQLKWDVSSSCRVEEAPPDVDVARFRRRFRLTAFDEGGQRVEIETGPETPNWVRYGSISRFMEVAVLTTEDGGFHRHHGFDHEAIKNSIRENLRKRKFVRGASTISMQLAKNLYLDRKKSLSRKLQEAVLTMYLEQALTKEQIMELYLNVVEFGPMVYGIGSASRHYFNASASQLSLGQALYLSSILPSPKVQYFVAGGAVSPRRMEYLKRLMKLAYDRKRIDDVELEEGLMETVIRGSPAPLRAPAAESGPTTSEPEQDGAEAPIEWAP